MKVWRGMVHGKVEISYDSEKKVRTFNYTDPSGKEYKGSLSILGTNYSFEVSGVGRRDGDTYKSASGIEMHCCGAQGFGQGIEDKCSACEINDNSFRILKDLVFLLEGKENGK